MQIILLRRVEKLGQMGDVVAVKPGFARNFLLPKGYAVRASKENLAEFEAKRAQLEAENLKHKQDAEKVAAKMNGLSIVIIRAAGESGHLYGSIRPQDVAEQVTKEGFTINRTQVLLDQPIKELGLHKVRIALHPEVAEWITVNVALSEEEAKLQAEGKLARGEKEEVRPEAPKAAKTPKAEEEEVPSEE